METWLRLRYRSIRKMFDSLRLRFRQRRYQQIQGLLKVENSAGFILDLGGGPASFFTAIFPRPERIILLDIAHGTVSHAKRRRSAIHAVVADGGRLPFADRSIAVVVCNSVIEHTTSPDLLASEICRIAHAFFLQTPNGGFPLETHSRVPIPLYNLIPWIGLRRLVCTVFGANFEYVDGVNYLSEPRLKSLFPRATMAYEKVLGLKKSFYIYDLDRK